MWRWPLDYYLLPAHYMSALLVPLSLWVVFYEKGKRSYSGIKKILIGITLLIFLPYFGYRLSVGIAIFSFDALKDDLAQELAKSEYIGKRVILPLTHPNSAEVGERLEYFINKKRSTVEQVNLYNFWEPPSPAHKNLDRFNGSAGIPPSPKQLEILARNPERFIIWKFGEDKYVEIDQKSDFRDYSDLRKFKPDAVELYSEVKYPTVWHFSFLRVGDLILVPSGTYLLNFMHARGIRMHAQNIENFIKGIPVRVKRIGSIKRGVGFFWLGWDILEVESIKEKGEYDYSLSLFKTLNSAIDILPTSFTVTLFLLNRLPESGVLLGEGWYDVEQSGMQRFRWMGRESEVILTHLPMKTCTLSFDVEPILGPESSPSRLNLKFGKAEKQYLLTGRKKITFTFDSTSKPLQILRLIVTGGIEVPPANDPRLLKMRVFEIEGPDCSAENGKEK